MKQTNPSKKTPTSDLDKAIDKTLPSDDPIIDRPDEQAAVEATRVGLEDQSASAGADVERNKDHMASGRSTVGGDPDAMQEQAKVVGEEAVGGTTPTPDQSNVDDIATAVGINTQSEQPVEVTDEMYRRDEQRYELDPDSKGPASSA